MPNNLKQKTKALKFKLKTLRAYVWRRYLYKATFIAITGSCGKTSATHFLGHILSSQSHCHVGIDQNTRKPVIKTLLKAKSSQRYVLQEVSGNEPGALASILPIFKPQVGIVTSIGRDHHTSFRTLEATANEKSVLVMALPKNGVAVLNADDPLVLAMARQTRARVITYGQASDADVTATNIKFSWPEGLTFTASYKGKAVPVETKLFGPLWVTTLLAAIAGAVAAGVDLDSCARSLSTVQAFSRRMSVHRSPAGVWFVDDTFKAPHWSIPHAIDVLKGLRASRKTLVLGSFSDSTGSSSSKYRALAKKGLEIADRVVFVGENSQHVARLITPELEGRLIVAETAEKACNLLFLTAVENEVVLIKSNNKDHLERLILGQSNQLACWKHKCSLQTNCAVCKESGVG